MAYQLEDADNFQSAGGPCWKKKAQITSLLRFSQLTDLKSHNRKFKGHIFSSVAENPLSEQLH